MKLTMTVKSAPVIILPMALYYALGRIKTLLRRATIRVPKKTNATAQTLNCQITVSPQLVIVVDTSISVATIETAFSVALTKTSVGSA